MKLEPYTYQPFSEITQQMLMLNGIRVEIAKATADAVWNKIRSRNIQDCIRIARMARSLEDVNFIVNIFLKYAARVVQDRDIIEYVSIFLCCIKNLI